MTSPAPAFVLGGSIITMGAAGSNVTSQVRVQPFQSFIMSLSVRHLHGKAFGRGCNFLYGMCNGRCW